MNVVHLLHECGLARYTKGVWVMLINRVFLFVGHFGYLQFPQ